MPYYTASVDGHQELYDAIVAAVTNVANGQDQWTVVANSSFRGVSTTSATSNLADTGQAMDLSSTTFWKTDAGAPTSDIFYRWEHFQPVELTELRMQAHANPNEMSMMPSDFNIQYSDNLIDWTSVATNESTTGVTWSASEVKRFVLTAAPGSHLHWRVYINANGGGSRTVIGSLFPYDAIGIYIGVPGSQIILRAPFSSEGNFPLVKLTLNGNKDGNWFNLGLQSGVSIANAVYDIGNSETLTYATLVNPSLATYFSSVDAVGANNITYWLIVNERRFACSTKADTIYTGCYGGLWLPYATPTQSPYPMAVGACSGNPEVSISDADDDTRTFVDPGSGSLQIYRPDNTWWNYLNYNGSSRSYDRNVWPYDKIDTSSSEFEDEVFLFGHTSVGTISSQPAYPLFPCILHEDTPQSNVLGELEGIFSVSGFNNTSENLINVAGVDHLVVQDLFRTDIGNYWAMKLE